MLELELVLSEGDSPSERHVSPPLSPNGLLDSDDEGVEKEENVLSEGGPISPQDLHYIFDRMLFTGGKVNSQHTHITANASVFPGLYNKM